MFDAKDFSSKKIVGFRLAIVYWKEAEKKMLFSTYKEIERSKKEIQNVKMF